jgi:hypothetical protein
LDAPDPAVWEIIKPILSHDTWEMEHRYVNTDLKQRILSLEVGRSAYFAALRMNPEILVEMEVDAIDEIIQVGHIRSILKGVAFEWHNKRNRTSLSIGLMLQAEILSLSTSLFIPFLFFLLFHYSYKK